jgi:c(7)-type cytochrome triheme protein
MIGFMRHLIAFFVTFSLAAGLGALAQPKKPPTKLVFQAKPGNVTYDHTAHLKRANGNCTVCHERLWPQSAQAPLNFKAGMHRPAEANQTSCGACHHAGGTAFETKGNCNRCHVRAAAAP